MYEDLKFYYIDTVYIDFLRQYQEHLWANNDKENMRPYIGVVIEVSGYKYYAPLTSPKPKHSTWRDSLDFIRIEHKGELKAAINLNNILPVDDSIITLVDMAKIKINDEFYYDLLSTEMIAIRKKNDLIKKNAQIVYNIVTKNREGHESLKKRCFDFKMLEAKCDAYIGQKNEKASITTHNIIKTTEITETIEIIEIIKTTKTRETT